MSKCEKESGMEYIEALGGNFRTYTVLADGWDNFISELDSLLQSGNISQSLLDIIDKVVYIAPPEVRVEPEQGYWVIKDAAEAIKELSTDPSTTDTWAKLEPHYNGLNNLVELIKHVEEPDEF